MESLYTGAERKILAAQPCKTSVVDCQQLSACFVRLAFDLCVEDFPKLGNTIL